MRIHACAFVRSLFSGVKKRSVGSPKHSKQVQNFPEAWKPLFSADVREVCSGSGVFCIIPRVKTKMQTNGSHPAVCQRME